MKTTVTLSYAELQSKLRHLDEEKKFTEQLIERYFTNPPHSVSASPSYSPSKATKPLIVDILKREGRKMGWKEVYAIFSKLKPEIAQSTVRVSLSQLGKIPKFPVKSGSEKYWYEETKQHAT